MNIIMYTNVISGNTIYGFITVTLTSHNAY